jgi:hypothetical protein
LNNNLCHACGHKAVISNAALLQGRPGYTRAYVAGAAAALPEMQGKGKAALDVEFRPRD